MVPTGDAGNVMPIAALMAADLGTNFQVDFAVAQDDGQEVDHGAELLVSDARRHRCRDVVRMGVSPPDTM